MRFTIIKSTKVASILTLCLCLLLNGCGRRIEASSFSSTRFMMGTVVALEVYGLSEDNSTQPAQAELETAVLEALDRMGLVAAQTDRYDEFTASDALQLARLAGTDQPLTVGDDIYALLERVQAYAHPEVDLTLGPLIDLWNQGRENQILPEQAQIAQALEYTGMEKIKINSNNQQVYLTQKGMSLDFGAVAKGYAIEKAWKSLQASGLSLYGIINAGGNIKTIGAKPDGSPWQIGLTDPLNQEQFLGVLQLNPNEAVATSGDYQRYFEIDEIRYHHLLNPSTGYPVNNHHAVTVVTADSFNSDYYSTLLFLLPTKEALELAESVSELEAIIVSQNKDIYITSGLSKRIEWNFQGGYKLVTP